MCDDSQGKDGDVNASAQVKISRFDKLDAKIDQIVARLPEPPPTKRGHQFASWLESSWGTRIVAAFGAWLIFLTLFAYWGEMGVRREERQARADEAEFRRLAQIATAWEVLLTRSGGDIGKGNALNTLIAAGHQVIGADLSCEAVGDWRDDACRTPPHFNNLALTDGDFWVDDAPRGECRSWSCDSRTYLRDVDFSEAEISSLVAESLVFDEGLRDVVGENWLVRRANRSDFDLPADEMKFQCTDCTIWEGYLSEGFFWGSARTLTLGQVEVDLWEAETIDRLANLDWGIRTAFLEAPPLLYRLDPWGIEFDREIKPEDFGRYFALEVYDAFRYCVSEADYQVLAEHIKRVDDEAQAEYDAQSRARLQARHLDGDKIEVGAVIYGWEIEFGLEQPIVIMDSEDFHPWKTLEVPWAAGQTRAFDCDFRFAHVEPLITQRLLAELNGDDGFGN